MGNNKNIGILLRHSILRNLVFALIVCSSSLFAQSNYESEDAMMKAADDFFEENNYEKALPLYSQLVSLYPKDATYNMKYGFSLLHADADKEACLKYLKYGVSKSESGEIATYYYARGLHSNYDFSKAIKSYQKFKSVASKKDIEKYQVDRQIEMCNNGKELLKDIFNLNVIDKKEINRTEFFRSYQLGEIGGKLIVKPDQFKTKLDLKSDDISLIHLPSDATVVYFAGYNDDKSKGKDIYRVRKSGNDWSSPENIGSIVNTPYDEDYPFMHPDGTLYFASKGHNSMGGYDLFKSEFNESTNTWSAPENLKFPVNSVFDDVLFISDYKKQLAYFASGRATTDGKFNVYRVQIARKPFDKAFLAGNFISEGNTEVNSAKITIYDVENNTKVGTYFTDKNSGKYNIGLPKGGKTYKFVVETDENSPVHTGKVDVPAQADMQSMKQEIRLVGNGDQQKLVIKNMFNETAPLDESMLIASLQNASNLEVNATEAEVLNDPTIKETQNPVESTNGGNVKENHMQLMADMTMLQAEIIEDLSSLKNQIAYGFKYSYEKAVVADQMYDQLEIARQKMVNEDDQQAKKKKLDELLVIKNKLDPIVSDAIVSFDFTRSLANEYDEKLNDKDRIKQDLTKMKSSNATTDEEMQEDLNLYGPSIADMKSMSSSFEIAPRRYEDLLSKSKEKLTREKTFYTEAKQDLEALQLELNRMEKEIEESKSKKAKEQLEAEKSSREIDLQDLEYEFTSINKKYKALKAEVKNLESDSKQINAFIGKIKANKGAVAQLSNEDQTELNNIIDFLKEQRLLEDVIGDEIEAFMTEGSAKESLSKAQKYKAVDNSGKSVDYDELYMVNVAALKLLEDEEGKFIELSKSYDNWANTIVEDLEIKNNDLAYTEDKAQKQILEEKIKALVEKEKEYRQISVEYQDKAVALNQVAISDGVNGNKESNETTSEDQKESKTPKGKANESKISAEGSTNVAALMATGFIASNSGRTQSLDEINKSYSASKKELEKSQGDDVSAEISLAAFELSWAKSIDKLIEEKEKEQKALSEDDPKWQELQTSIDKYKEEKDNHVKNASGEFTTIQIEQQLGDSPAEEMPKYYIPFDPENPNFDSYNEEYRKLVEAVENHQILSREQKDKELSMIHNYWSVTIQDEILWQEKEKTKLKSQAELLEIENKVLDLNVAKKEHIKLSNEYYQKYKSSALFKEDIENTEAKEMAGTSSGVSKEEANSFGEYAAVYANYKSEKEAKLQLMESDMAQVGSKGEKQQISLSMALIEREMKEEAEAEQELKSKTNAPILSLESEEQLKEKNQGSWKEQAEDYVFTKKDFTSNVPENANALENYQDARSAYNEVQYLESQKTGLLTSSVVNKNAETEIVELQEQIDAKKIEAYESLAKANKVQYQSNKKEIELLMEANPDLEKTNPKLFRDIQAADVVYNEVEKYLENAQGFKSNALKFDIYDQAQFMSEYVLNEQEAIIVGLKGETYTGELAFLATSSEGSVAINEELASFKIERKEMEAIVQNPIFKEYEKDRMALEEIKKERKTVEAEVIESESQLKLLVDQRNMIVQTAAGQKGGKKKKLMKEAEVVEQEIEVQQKKVDSVTLEMVKLKEQENNINRNSARLLKQASVDDRYKMVMLAELRLREAQEGDYVSEVPVDKPLTESQDIEVGATEVIEQEVITEGEAAVGVSLPTSTTTLNNDEFKTLGTEIPQELEGDLFITAATTTVSPYNANKPIPVDVEIPTGLVFKVQIGAYRNPIPQDLFKGFAPLMGEKLDNGITRYTAGLFRDFGNANKAKNEIRKIGYEDAFVVAFVNGKRISFQELQGLEDIDISLPPPVADNTYNGVPPEVLTIPSIIDDEGEISSAIAEQTTNTAEVKGIFFAVQVGVYTNTLLPQKLKVFRELNSELMPNGNVRYSVGQFKGVDEARQRKENVTNEVADAFVTAYENGRRISVSEAVNKLNQGGQ